LPAGQKTGGAACNQNKIRWRAAAQAAEKALPEFLLRHRWYPAKDAGLPHVELAEFVSLNCSQCDAAIAIWRVHPPRSPALQMFVPLAIVPSAGADQTIATIGSNGENQIVDALSLDTFVRAWLKFQLAENSGPFGSGLPLLAGRTGHAFAIETPSAVIGRSRVEQSNTSFRISDSAMIKFIRKLEAGPHPELEIDRFLAAKGFPATPPLVGWTEFVGQRNQRIAVSLLQEFVPNQGDGWSWTLDQLARGITAGERQALQQLDRWLQTLARRLAELHGVFASDSDDPDFRPEPVTPGDLRKWESAGGAMAERAVAGIESYRAGDEASPLVAALLNRREAVTAQLRKIGDLESSFSKTRHHGDFHLGQVLVAGTDAFIIDFEGEPLRPLARRRMKHCVLRDVAGALRSLSYAAATVARALPSAIPDEEREQLTNALKQWRVNAARNFVQAYLNAAAGLASLPKSRDETAILLNFFVLEKALYEIAYELANRPDWVAIPLAGVVSLIANQGAE
jgi:trehalose synthase-fused probable maltokinase